jgi:hypothetical protein
MVAILGIVITGLLVFFLIVIPARIWESYEKAE